MNDLESQMPVLLAQLAEPREPADIIRPGDAVSWRPKNATAAGRIFGVAVAATTLHQRIPAWRVLDERGIARIVRSRNISKECG